MLKAFREVPVYENSGSHHAYLEAWRYSDDSDTRTSTLTVKPLEESDAGDWAWRRGSFDQQRQVLPGRRLAGGLRVLFTQPKLQFRAAIPSVLVSGHVLEALNLPSHVFASFQLLSGVFSVHTYPEGSTMDSCSRLSLVFRTPHRECSIGGYALSHDFDTSITTALILGSCFDLDGYGDTQTGSTELPPTFKEFVDQVQGNENLWCHPLVLPCLLLITHVRMVRSYIISQISLRITSLEQMIGVTREDRPFGYTTYGGALHDGGRYYFSRPVSSSHDRGRHHIMGPDTVLSDRAMGQLFVDGRLQRDQAKVLTQSINTITTWIILAKRSPQWDMECVKFLRRVLDGSSRLSNQPDIPAQVFRETLDYVESYSEVCLEVTQTSEARMQLHLNILYTSIAQDDGQTSARLAAAAGRDSTSMKIIALITAAYLPATFVATLFSMGMFEWKGSDSGADVASATASTVSPDFWMYWAAAIPLTIITLLGWAAWWKFEQHRFVVDIQQAAKGDQPPQKPRASYPQRSRGFSTFWPLAHRERKY